MRERDRVAESSFRRVCRSDELPAGSAACPEVRRVKIGGDDALLARRPDGRLVAFAAHCPHQGTSLVHASFWDGNVRCPQHRYSYDPETGANVAPSREASADVLWKLKPGYLRLYPVEERDGWIWVAETPKPPPPGYDAALEASPPEPHEARGSGAGPGATRDAGVPAHRPAATEAAEEPTERLEADAGADVVLDLPTVVHPGHVWRAEIAGEAVAVVRQEFVPGERPAYRLHLVAREAGVATVRCVYAKPWERAPRDVRIFVIRVR